MKKMFEVATMQSLSSSDFSETQVEIVEQLKKNSMKWQVKVKNLPFSQSYKYHGADKKS